MRRENRNYGSARRRIGGADATGADATGLTALRNSEVMKKVT